MKKLFPLFILLIFIGCKTTNINDNFILHHQYLKGPTIFILDKPYDSVWNRIDYYIRNNNHFYSKILDKPHGFASFYKTHLHYTHEQYHEKSFFPKDSTADIIVPKGESIRGNINRAILIRNYNSDMPRWYSANVNITIKRFNDTITIVNINLINFYENRLGVYDINAQSLGNYERFLLEKIQ